VAVSGSRSERIATVAERQRGRIERAQLLAIGIPDRAIYRLVAHGYLIRRRRGVYAVGHAAAVELAAETEALLACGDGAALSYFTAGRLWQILPHRATDGHLIHITVPGRHGADPDGIRVHRSDSLRPTSIHQLHELPVTSPGRTLLDLAEGLNPADLDWAVDEAVQRDLVSPDPLTRYARQHPGRRGAGKLAAAAARHRPTGVTKSQAEKRYRALIRSAGLPDPLTNVKLHGFTVDCYWPDHHLVVEVDSQRWHSIQPKVEHDSVKRATLVAAGLVVMSVTWQQMEQEPYAVVARTAQALARAA
jgi:very-short-patch-repair endonuclease